MSAGTYLGIDVGTSVAKAALFTGDGDLVATAARPISLWHPTPLQVEQSPDEVISALGTVVAEVIGSTGGAVDLVAITGQGDGCWLLDDAGHAVRPAISWLDARGARIVAEWAENDVADAVFRVNGNAMFPGAQGPILRWLDEHEPHHLDASATAGYCKDMIFQRLTGERATDASDASLPFGDGRGGYSGEVLRRCGLSHRADLLAPIVAPLPSATVSVAGSRALGLAVGTRVCAGPFDLPACAAGGGVRAVGDGLLTVGTTLACQVVSGRIDTTGAPTGMNLLTGGPGRSLRAMAAMVGTASLDWLLATLGLRHDQIAGALAASPVGANGVSVLPYLAPSGERAPFVDPAASGQFHGVRLTTSREDLVRGLCEGLAYAARQCLDAAGLTGRVVVCGGGTRSAAWMTIFASVLGRPLEMARNPEVGARGAVVAALEATGAVGATDLDRWTRPERVVEPDPAASRYYEDGYRRYLAQQDRARELWHL